MSEFYYQKKHSILLFNTLNYIRDIEIKRLSSEIKLRDTIRKKYLEYITFRQTTAYNPDNDCIVCYESKCDFTSGQNCMHLVCIDCFEKIVSATNKCPICRENLENKTETETETEEEDEIDSEEEGLFDGTNERPTTNLYRGRRWFNTETNTIEYYVGNDEWSDDNLFSYYTFIKNSDNYNELRACNCCGIQRTIEVNNYMSEVYGGNFYYAYGINTPQSFITEWEKFFNEEFEWCFDCHKKHRVLQSEFDRLISYE
jgi:hypothetical protein